MIHICLSVHFSLSIILKKKLLYSLNENQLLVNKDLVKNRAFTNPVDLPRQCKWEPCTVWQFLLYLFAISTYFRLISLVGYPLLFSGPNKLTICFLEMKLSLSEFNKAKQNIKKLHLKISYLYITQKKIQRRKAPHFS